MTDSKAKSNAEVAREIVKRCGIRDGLFKGPRTFNAVETITYALDSAQSQLAGEVLKLVQPIANRDHAGEECLHELRDLFTRLGIKVGE